jgi:hypothetical protein
VASLFGLLLFAGFVNHANAAYQYYRSITVTSTASVASGTNANFPMLVSSTLTSWEASSTGGKIQNLVTEANGGQEPADLVFATSTNNCGTANLNFETEHYVSSTGEIEDWVNVPSLATNTIIYACYDNNSVTTDQSHPSSTWDSNYAGVWHFPTINGNVNASDSTANANNGTAVTATATSSCEIDGCAYFTTPPSQYITVASSSSLDPTSTITWETWINSVIPSGGTQQVMRAVDLAGGSNSGYSTLVGLVAGTVTVALNVTGVPTLSSAISTSTWTQVVGGYNGSTFSLYVDGLLTANSSQSGATTYSNGTFDFGVTRTSDGTNGYSGSIDEARVSKIARSSQWILTEYNNQSSPSTFYAVGNETSLTPPTISSFAASSSVVASAGTSTLSWNATGTITSIAITPGSFSTSTAVGSTAVNPTSTITYTLTATNANGTSTATTTVTVESLTISSLAASSINSNSATITWTTSIPADSTVSYGTTIAYGATSTDPTLATSHSIGLSSLAGNTTYHFAVISSAIGTSTTSGDHTFSTSGASSRPSGPTIDVPSAYGSPYVPGVGFVISSTPLIAVSADLQPSILVRLNLLTAELDALLAQAIKGNTPLPMTSLTFVRNLDLWDTGSDVTALQQLLINQNAGAAAKALAQNGTTKTFGFLTYKALKEFQKFVGIKPVSGYFGPITRSHVNNLIP